MNHKSTYKRYDADNDDNMSKAIYRFCHYTFLSWQIRVELNGKYSTNKLHWAQSDDDDGRGGNNKHDDGNHPIKCLGLVNRITIKCPPANTIKMLFVMWLCVIWRAQSMIPHYASFIIDYIVVIIISMGGSLSPQSPVASPISIEFERSLSKYIYLYIQK